MPIPGATAFERDERGARVPGERLQLGVVAVDGVVQRVLHGAEIVRLLRERLLHLLGELLLGGRDRQDDDRPARLRDGLLRLRSSPLFAVCVFFPDRVWRLCDRVVFAASTGASAEDNFDV